MVNEINAHGGASENIKARVNNLNGFTVKGNPGEALDVTKLAISSGLAAALGVDKFEGLGMTVSIKDNKVYLYSVGKEAKETVSRSAVIGDYNPGTKKIEFRFEINDLSIGNKIEFEQNFKAAIIDSALELGEKKGVVPRGTARFSSDKLKDLHKAG